MREALLIEFTGWTWDQLCAAPAWLVSDILLVMEGHAIRAKELSKG